MHSLKRLSTVSADLNGSCATWDVVADTHDDEVVSPGSANASRICELEFGALEWLEFVPVPIRPIVGTSPQTEGGRDKQFGFRSVVSESQAVNVVVEL